MLPPRNYAPRGRAGREGYSKPHRDFVKKHLCILWNQNDCDDGPVDFCHARSLAPFESRGASLKCGDEYGFGACRKHHSASEKREVLFSQEHGIDLMAICKEFAMASPDRAIRERAKLMPSKLP